MSKIKNGGLNQYGAGPFEQQQFVAAGVEGVKLAGNVTQFTKDVIVPSPHVITHRDAGTAGPRRVAHHSDMDVHLRLEINVCDARRAMVVNRVHHDCRLSASPALSQTLVQYTRATSYM